MDLAVARPNTGGAVSAGSRLKVLLRQLEQAARAQPGGPLPVSTRGSSREKLFWKGVLAHLLVVPAWTVPPAGLLAGVVAAGAPHGLKGVLAGLGLGGALAAGVPNQVRVLLCAALVALAAASKRSKAIVGASIASLLCWATSCGKYPRYKGLFDYVSRWAPDYYAQAELRGALGDIRQERTFFAFHPHGCLCAGFTINGTFNPEFLRRAGKVAFLCDPGLRYRNPGFRMMSDAYETDDRAIDACDAGTFRAYMSKGHSLAFCPGGFLDAVSFQFGKDSAVLSDRKAFVKFCLQYGYRVHPVYTFGECETYYTWTGLRNVRMKIARKNVPSIAFFGWPLCPILPRTQSKILTYVGKGIDFPKMESPSQSDVDYWHNLYTQKLRELFDEHKAEVGQKDAELEIL